ncbi:hypothetical protein QEH59_01250 [Coraliomargarita sp. SDUM461004]|uniref:Uncharacterized protein n=1 Tax=Thalassobacterium sedimentorum TaxID=3041258 RepID=A0ABU1AE65_9BACT|nr:hypothetical protein [Coraliomargarita sp. SDUM461004]MDQ8193032.1 hypothetical protein [Coraliomargarita sp. SDUM461004]
MKHVKGYEVFFYYLPAKERERYGAEQSVMTRWFELSREEIRGPFPLDDPIVIDQKYGKNWDALAMNWVVRHTRELSVTIEIAWNSPHSTTDGYF